MKRFDQINVIPFIDIMLVLLAIVLTTASFIAQGHIPLDLPEAEAGISTDTDRQVEIAVTTTGLLHLDGEAIHRHVLRERLAALPADTAILLRVDQAARFQAFVDVMDTLRALGLTQVHIATARPD